MDRERRMERDADEQVERKREQDRLQSRSADRQAEQWLDRNEAEVRDAERHRLALSSKNELRGLEVDGKVDYTDRQLESIEADKLIIDPRQDADDDDRRRLLMRQTNRANENAFLDKRPALDEIERNPELREMAVHSTDDNPIEVTEYKGHYIVEEGSFDRVRNARDMGLEDVPVHVRRAEPKG